MHIFRHLARKLLAGRQPSGVVFIQSDEKSDWSSLLDRKHPCAPDLISASLSIIDRKNIRSSSRLNNSIIINKDRLFIEQSVIDTLIKPALKMTKHHSVLYKALDTAGYLYKTNGYQCPLEIMDMSGNSQLLRTYCFESKILSNANYKAIFAPLNQESESFLMDCHVCIPEYFLPLATTADGKVAGRILRKEDEENNHILITGVGGYGKTYALCRIAAHLAELEHP